MTSPAQNNSCLDGTTTGMAWSVLSEISQRLSKLCESGEQSVISLRNLPMTDADRQQLEELLGRGEVRADLEVSGHSEVWETGYPGVWWVQHQDPDGTLACEEISITPIPEILLTHPVDMQTAASRLEQELLAMHQPDHPTN